jgi:hypothetical protein
VIEAHSGLVYRRIADGDTVSGIYSRSVLLVSGRFAMLDDGVGFSLVPWRPFIDKRLGQSMCALVREERASWEFKKINGTSGAKRR